MNVVNFLPKPDQKRILLTIVPELRLLHFSFPLSKRRCGWKCSAPQGSGESLSHSYRSHAERRAEVNIARVAVSWMLCLSHGSSCRSINSCKSTSASSGLDCPDSIETHSDF